MKSQTRLSDFNFTFHFHALEKEMEAHSCILAWRIPRTAEPGGLPSKGSHRVGHDWSNLAAAAAGIRNVSMIVQAGFGPRLLRCIWKECIPWAQMLATSHTKKSTKLLRYLVFLNWLTACLHPSLLQTSKYPNSFPHLLEAISLGHLRCCLPGPKSS